jgi:DNA-binding transcriptional MerR regulator
MGEVLGFDTPAVARIAGVPPSTLNHWARTKLVVPSLIGSRGQRATRWWSMTDLVAVKAIKALRQAGCPLQTLRRVQSRISEQGGDFGNRVLRWTGDDVLVVDGWGDVTSAVEHPGQLVFQMVAIPLRDWMEEVESSDELRTVDPSRLNRLDRERKQARRSSTG